MRPRTSTDADTKQMGSECKQFQMALQAGLQPRIEHYCEDWPEPERSELIFRLLTLELADLGKRDILPTRHEYQQRFPHHIGIVEHLLPARDKESCTSLSHSREIPDDGARPIQLVEPIAIPIPNEDHRSALVPEPDAPLHRVGRGIIRVVHSLVLVGIVGLLFYYFMTLAKQWQQPAVVKIVAPNLIEISSPTEGVFVAIDHVPRGTPVEKGQVLGQIRAPKHEAALKAAQRRLANLRGQRILMRDQMRDQPWENERLLEVYEKVLATKNEIDRLKAISQQLTVRSPDDGLVESGFSGSKAVTTHETVATIWPNGGVLLLEVRAPLDAVHDLIMKQEVKAYFSTVDGKMLVRGEPIADSLRPVSVNEDEPEKQQEVWGLIQCRVLSMPAEVARPGLIGRL